MCLHVLLCCIVQPVLLRTLFVHAPHAAPSVLCWMQVELNATFYGWFEESTYDAWRERCVKRHSHLLCSTCQTMQSCR
jgi:hypothetical protein